MQDSCFFAISGLLYCHGRSQANNNWTPSLGLYYLRYIRVHKYVRVYEQFIETLVHLADYIDANLLVKYTGPILEQTRLHYLSVLKSTRRVYCCNLSLSESIKGPQLAVYYDAVVPILKLLLEYARSNKLEILYGQAMECCAMFGEASGKEKFHQDALEMMHSMAQLDIEFTEESSARPYLMKAWVRVARCLGTEFSPFLPLIMGHLLKAVSQDIKILSDDLDDLENELENQSDVEYAETDEGWVAVRHPL